MIGVGIGKGDGGVAIFEGDDHQRSHGAAIGAQQWPAAQDGIAERADVRQVRRAGGDAQIGRIGLVDAVDGKIGQASAFR